MSITPVPISMRLVLTPIAASSGNGEESCRAKWWTRTNAPSMPISSAATASSTVCRNASSAVCVSPPPGCQAPNERKPIFFGFIVIANVVDCSSIPALLPHAIGNDPIVAPEPGDRFGSATGLLFPRLADADDAVAVSVGPDRLSYLELSGRAAHIADRLAGRACAAVWATP